MYTAKDKDLNDYYQKWLDSTEDTLYKTYDRHSAYKDQAWERCKDIMQERNGNSLRVVSYNGFIFTAAFVTDTDFYVITKANIYRMPLSEVK